MDEQERRREQAGTWIDAASLRLAECQAELRRLEGGGHDRRRQKIADRAERYRDLLDRLRGLLEQVREAPASRIEKLDAERAALQARLLELAREMAKTVGRWKELRSRWGSLAHEMMREREEAGRPGGRVPALDFRFPPPAPEAPPEDRVGHDILRSIGL